MFVKKMISRRRVFMISRALVEAVVEGDGAPEGELVVNQRLHGGRTAAAVPPERGVRLADASSERIACGQSRVSRCFA